jgi:hypothetical protein
MTLGEGRQLGTMIMNTLPRPSQIIGPQLSYVSLLKISEKVIPCDLTMYCL